MTRNRAKKVDMQDAVEQLRHLLVHYGQPFPDRLATRFPHIVKRILAVWNIPDKAQRYFNILLQKEGNGYQGFPLDVYQEIYTLSAFYSQQFSALKERRDIWSGFAI